MKKQLAIILVILATIMAITSFLILSRKKNNPPIEVIDPNKNTVELYEELSLNDVQKIMITTVNVNVKVISSDTNNVRIIYKPFTDEKAFKYELVDGLLTLSINEVKGNKYIIPTDSEMIYLYLPKNNKLDLVFVTGSGFIDIDEVNTSNIEVKSTSGVVSIGDSNVAESLLVSADYGKIAFRNTNFKQLTINAISASVACFLDGTLDNYYLNLMTNIGDITINGKKVENPYTEVITELVEFPTVTISNKTGKISLHFETETGQ